MDGFVHIPAQIHALKNLILSGQRQGEAGRCVECGFRVSDAYLKHMTALSQILCNEMEVPADTVQPAHEGRTDRRLQPVDC